MVKKLLALFMVLIISILSCSCGISEYKSERKMLELGEFTTSSEGINLLVNVSFKKDKKYDFYFRIKPQNSDEIELDLKDKTYSHIVTFNNEYTVYHDRARLISTTESITYHVYKLEDCIGMYGSYLDKQGYFIFKDSHAAVLYFTNEEINQEHFDQYKNENGYIQCGTFELLPKSAD